MANVTIRESQVVQRKGLVEKNYSAVTKGLIKLLLELFGAVACTLPNWFRSVTLLSSHFDGLRETI
jgi:hypothetical protein